MLGSQDGFYSTCKPLIEDIESKKVVAVFSYLTMLETIHTLRRRKIEKSSFTGGSRSECESKKAPAEVIVRDFVRVIRELSSQQKILIPRPKMTLFDHHSTVVRKIKQYFGYIRTMSYCPICESGYVKRDEKIKCPSCGDEKESLKKYQYKALGHADLEHAFCAKYANVPVFYSTDKSFSDLNGDPDFGSMRFEIIPYPAQVNR